MSDANAQLTQVVSDLQDAVTAEVAQMDTNFAALQAAIAANNPAAVNDAITKIQANIQTLRDAAARDVVP